MVLKYCSCVVNCLPGHLIRTFAIFPSIIKIPSFYNFPFYNIKGFYNCSFVYWLPAILFVPFQFSIHIVPNNTDPVYIDCRSVKLCDKGPCNCLVYCLPATSSVLSSASSDDLLPYPAKTVSFATFVKPLPPSPSYNN